ncbi:phycocyanin alpha phycocyanobilin lyase related protein NblB [Geminocystis sp. NIES-3708]|uniref:HEAT repeat domain-containing protein n=1 Tax=Geminocystis sp. NIES-3708 TaxID=1615909 RepID=UPI0005FC583D|nr:HEAT repeat domain-containing protein [Geminocystis sp. NIES-3708]BAQ61072.1 phycocyanin alpha phycocyanobilin lyase related protein NblB [Geminocystis sp. NIES-3708]
MDINQIKIKLASQDFQDRLDGVTALGEINEDAAIPLLISMTKDSQFLVRSFVAMILGKKKTAESMVTLLEMLKFDQDTNVRSEACNALSFFGDVSIPHLQQAFHQDDNWLVRLSILAAFMDLNCYDQLFDICLCGIAGDDEAVRETSISALGQLAGSFKETEALNQLLTMVNNPSWRIRMKVAKALSYFNDSKAQEALNLLKKDEDHRVVGAVLEKVIINNGQ